MNSSKVIVVGLIVCSVIFFSSSSVMAAAAWFTATVDSSTAGTTFQCQLTGTEEGGSRSFTKKIFLLFEPLQNSMLAVLLSAQSMDSSVRVFVDPDNGKFPIIYGIGLKTE